MARRGRGEIVGRGVAPTAPGSTVRRGGPLDAALIHNTGWVSPRLIPGSPQSLSNFFQICSIMAYAIRTALCKQNPRGGASRGQDQAKPSARCETTSGSFSGTWFRRYRRTEMELGGRLAIAPVHYHLSLPCVEQKSTLRRVNYQNIIADTLDGLTKARKFT